MTDRDTLADLEAWAEERPRTGSKQLHGEAARAAGRALLERAQDKITAPEPRPRQQP